MSEAAAATHAGAEPSETPLTPENWGKLGMWLFLAGDAMSAYKPARCTGPSSSLCGRRSTVWFISIRQVGLTVGNC